jgi:general secretion pathway protein K
MKRRAEQGAALLTVLLLVAVMSVLAVSVIDDIRFSIRRTSNAEAVGQARWYALSAEVLARRQIEAGLGAEGLGEWRSAGQGSARITDAGTCFNLNSVVEGKQGQWLRREASLRQYRALLAALEFSEPQARALSEALADWIDSDQGRSAEGAEDEAYAGYRTSAGLLSETSELRAIRGYDAAVYSRIRPYVCALPSAEITVLNVNALRLDQGVLLSAITGGEVSRAAGETLISSRPSGGWTSVSDVLALDGMKNLAHPPAGQLSVRPRYYGLTVKVAHQGAEVVMTSMLEKRGEGPVMLHARRWTVEE